MARFGQGFINALTQPSYGQGLMETAAGFGGLGGDLIKIKKEKQQQQQVSKIMQLANAAIANNDDVNLSRVAQQFAKIPGFEKQALEFAKAAQGIKQKRKEDEINLAQLNSLRESVVDQATNMGLSDVAQRARKTSDLQTLNSLSTTLTEKQLEGLPELSPQGRRQALVSVGYPPREAAQIVASQPSKQEFQQYLDLQKGDVEMYLDQSGKPVTYRTTEYGMVVVDGKLVDPSTLGLREAPHQQIVENVSSTMAANIAKLGAENFNDLYGQATKAEESIRSIDNIIGDVDTMFSGSLANVALQINKFMKAFGIPADDLAIENTEVFIAESAKRVADYITNLGAGTGLSDKDLEFTRKVVAGDVTLDANTISRMLKEFRQASERKINNYMKTRSNIGGRLKQNEEGALDFYLPITVPQPSGLSDNARQYLKGK